MIDTWPARKIEVYKPSVCLPCLKRYGRVCTLSLLGGADEEEAKDGPLSLEQQEEANCPFLKKIQAAREAAWQHLAQ